MAIKKWEFLDLQQRGRSVMEYVQKFNHLAQYTPDEVNNNDRKRYHFVNGLFLKMQDRLSVHEFADFNWLVSTSLTIEFKMRGHQEEKKRKRFPLHSVGGTSQYTRTESQPPPSHMSTLIALWLMWIVQRPSPSPGQPPRLA